MNERGNGQRLTVRMWLAPLHCTTLQGIVKQRNSAGKLQYTLFLLYFTSRAVEEGEEVLLSWDADGELKYGAQN